MAKKKSAQPEDSPAEHELVKRVDAMMRVDKSSDVQTASRDETPVDEAEDAAFHEDETVEQPTAPQLPPKLLKTVSTAKTAKPKKSAKTALPHVPEPMPTDEADSTGDDPPERIIKLHVSESLKPEDLSKAVEEPDDSETSDDPLPAKDPLADSETDRAVDDIVASEADLQLAVDDAKARRRAAEAAEGDSPGLLRAFFTNPWTWLFILGIAGVAYAWFH